MNCPFTLEVAPAKGCDCLTCENATRKATETPMFTAVFKIGALKVEKDAQCSF